MRVHIHAANRMENSGFYEEPVEHYLEGKQTQDAVRLIEKNLHELVHSKTVFYSNKQEKHMFFVQSA